MLSRAVRRPRSAHSGSINASPHFVGTTLETLSAHQAALTKPRKLSVQLPRQMSGQGHIPREAGVHNELDSNFVRNPRQNKRDSRMVLPEDTRDQLPSPARSLPPSIRSVSESVLAGPMLVVMIRRPGRRARRARCPDGWRRPARYTAAPESASIACHRFLGPAERADPVPRQRSEAVLRHRIRSPPCGPNSHPQSLRSRARYWIASATCARPMSAWSSRSATVRASFRMRS